MELQDPATKIYPDAKKLLRNGIIIFIIATILVAFMPLLATKFTIIGLDTAKPNEIGDTIGGIFGPCVGLIAAALSFLAFWAQYAANIEQRKQFDQSLYNEQKANEREQTRLKEQVAKENEDLARQQKQFEATQHTQQTQLEQQERQSRITLFETRFYTMLSIQRDNSMNMEVNNIGGRKVFLHMLDELSFIYQVTDNRYQTHFKKIQTLTREEVYNVAYLSFFFGIGEKSTPMVKDLVGSRLEPFVDNVHQLILNAKENNAVADYIFVKVESQRFRYEKVYSLGTGHLRRLSHYIRHLYQTVKFVDDQPKELISAKDKYAYLSNLRAQLSVHEQLLLFYNALSVLGKPWLDIASPDAENYLTKYCLIKSIPLNAADFYKTPLEYFPTPKNKLGHPLFEWSAIKERIQELPPHHT